MALLQRHTYGTPRAASVSALTRKTHNNLENGKSSHTFALWAWEADIAKPCLSQCAGKEHPKQLGTRRIKWHLWFVSIRSGHRETLPPPVRWQERPNTTWNMKPLNNESKAFISPLSHRLNNETKTQRNLEHGASKQWKYKTMPRLIAWLSLPPGHILKTVLADHARQSKLPSLWALCLYYIDQTTCTGHKQWRPSLLSLYLHHIDQTHATTKHSHTKRVNGKWQ